MIYTVTLNPAIDLVIVTAKMAPNVVNRTEKFELQPNGKGVNVSFILQKLGIDSVATGIGGGATLDYVTDGLAQKQIATHFLKVKEPTRVNVFTRVLDQDVEYKEVNPGPEIDQATQEEFLAFLKKTLKPDDIVVVSGSFSTGIAPAYLVKLAQLAQSTKVQLVIDSSYLAVLDTLSYHPFLLKPNEEELAAFFDFDGEITDEQTVIFAKKLIAAGCQNVLVSLGSRGAALINQEHIYFANAPKVKVLNTAGAGDTMLGTFVASLVKQKSMKEALKLAVAAGSDTASKTGLTDFALTELLQEIVVEERMK